MHRFECVRHTNVVNKSHHNHEAGEWAEAKGYVEVAISRYYYSIYQKMIHMLRRDPVFASRLDTANHRESIGCFVEFARSRGIGETDAAFLTWIQVFRQQRNTAEYQEGNLTEKAFSVSKSQYAKVREIMERLN